MDKKHDDYRPAARTRFSALWRLWLLGAPSPRPVRRVVALMLIGALVFLTLRTSWSRSFATTSPDWRDGLGAKSPSDFLIPVGNRELLPSSQSGHSAHLASSVSTPIKPAAAGSALQLDRANNGAAHCEKKKYAGPLRFAELAKTLTSSNPKHVIFAAASLRSAAALLPLACRMGMEGRSLVHFALMGDSQISIEDLALVNGIDKSCQLTIHDARPEFANAFTTERLEFSVSRALYHIHDHKTSRVVITDSSAREEQYFLKATRLESVKLKLTLIELPEDAARQISWISKLDSASLSGWNDVQVDILIQAPTVGSGGLIRLLRSLAAADLAPMQPPRITIELPSKVEKATLRFLDEFRWPPAKAHDPNPLRTQLLSVRRRARRRDNTTAEDGLVRFLELAWPVHPTHSHVLLLSTDVEVSPAFFQYLHFSILEYRYSTIAKFTMSGSILFGISLTLPSDFAHGADVLKPVELSTSDPISPARSEGGTPLLWPLPSSRAMLIMGERWLEVYGFVTEAIDVEEPSRSLLPALSTEKWVGEDEPAWMEHVVRLCSARGYYTLYPSPIAAQLIAETHNDLSSRRAPSGQDARRRHGAGGTWQSRNGLAVSNPLAATAAHPQVEMMDVMQKAGIGLDLSQLPILSLDKKVVGLAEHLATAKEYAVEFRRRAGCRDLVDNQFVEPDRFARDLFCVPDDR